MAAVLGVLAGCQVTPRIDSETRAQVLSMPVMRSSLGGGSLHLHAALRAGVTRAEVEAGRLVRGWCTQPDLDGDEVTFSVTTLLPPGMAWPVPTLVDIATTPGLSADAVGARDRRQHGRFLGLGPVLDERSAAPGRGTGPRRALCRPAGAAPGVLRVEPTARIQGWEYDAARAELARHDQFTDAELAARTVMRVSCRVEALGDPDFMRVEWLARVPAELGIVPGDVVRIRVGAREDSRDVAPIARIVARADRPAGPSAGALVKCD